MHGVQPLAAVRAVLEGYARRGVFRSLSEEGTTFRFHWLWNAPFVMEVDMKSNALVFRRLLPGVIPDDVKLWLREAASENTVKHRRAPRATLSRGSLRFRVRDGDFADTARKALQTVNELFVSHLSARRPAYITEHFHVSED